jgi:hypothetical protein
MIGRAGPRSGPDMIDEPAEDMGDLVGLLRLTDLVRPYAPGEVASRESGGRQVVAKLVATHLTIAQRSPTLRSTFTHSPSASQHSRPPRFTIWEQGVGSSNLPIPTEFF